MGNPDKKTKGKQKLRNKLSKAAKQTMLTDVPVLQGAGLFFGELSLKSLLSYGVKGSNTLKY